MGDIRADVLATGESCNTTAIVSVWVYICELFSKLMVIRQ